MKYTVDKKGFYGNYGGAFVPEMLFPNLDELEKKYKKIINDIDFQEDYNNLLKDYVGRPTPLYFAERMSEKYKSKIYLKREDLCHTCLLYTSDAADDA